jgi:subtilase family serine protease
VWVDPAGEVVESDENNNLAWRSTVLPDLTLGNPYVNYYEGLQEISLSARITNSGAYSATTFHVEFRQGALTGTLVGFRTMVHTGTMGVGEGQEISVTWYSPVLSSSAEPIYVLVDPENWVSEADEENNVALIWVAAQPDLAIDAYDIVGDELIHLTVHNLGYVDANDVIVAIHLEGISGTLLLPATISMVPAGSRTTLVVRPAVPAGPYDLYVVVDPDNAIAEVNESNNVASKAVLLEDVRIYLPIIIKDDHP